MARKPAVVAKNKKTPRKVRTVEKPVEKVRKSKPKIAPAPAPVRKRVSKPETAPAPAATAPARATKLAEWRELMGFSKVEMAEKMNVTPGYYGRIEGGLSFPRPAMLALLLDITGKAITPNDIFDGLVSLD